MASTTTNAPAAATPPYGQTSNFVNPATQQDAIIAVCTGFLVLTLFFVGLRLYSAVRITHSIGVEDYVCIAAAIFSFANAGMIITMSHMSRHMWDMPAYWLGESYWKRRFAQFILMTFAFLTSRFAFLLLYFRLFGSNRETRYAIYFGGLAVSLIYLVNIPLLPVFCAPLLENSWDTPGVLAKCRRLIPYTLVYGVGNIFLDLYIMLLPMPMIWRLQLPFEKKLGISVLFTTGAIVVIASIVGIIYRIRYTFGTDLTWNQGAFDAICIVEVNTAIICSSMPACASFFKYMSANSTFFVSVRSTFGRSKPSRDISTNECKSRGKTQTWLAMKSSSGSRHHTSPNSWQKDFPDSFNSCTNMANPGWPEDPEGGLEAHSEQLKGKSNEDTEDRAADVEEESRATNGIMKSITVNITSQKNPMKQ